MRTFKITLFAVLLSSLAVMCMAGLGMTADSQPGAFRGEGTMSNISTAAPLGSHSISPEEQ